MVSRQKFLERSAPTTVPGTEQSVHMLWGAFTDIPSCECFQQPWGTGSVNIPHFADEETDSGQAATAIPADPRPETLAGRSMPAGAGHTCVGQLNVPPAPDSTPCRAGMARAHRGGRAAYKLPARGFEPRAAQLQEPRRRSFSRV